jgi:hypothetical protein
MDFPCGPTFAARPEHFISGESQLDGGTERPK